MLRYELLPSNHTLYDDPTEIIRTLLYLLTFVIGLGLPFRNYIVTNIAMPKSTKYVPNFVSWKIHILFSVL